MMRRFDERRTIGIHNEAVQHFIYQDNKGDIFVSGNNEHGQLGIGKTLEINSPHKLKIRDVVDFSYGSSHSLFLTKNGKVYVCGSNMNGQLGVGNDVNLSHKLILLKINNICKVYAKGKNSVFLDNQGKAWVCGLNESGQLGLGDRYSRCIPQEVGIPNVKSVALGFSHALFLDETGSVWGCGSNMSGQLGNIGNICQETPIKLMGLPKISKISCGRTHSFFLDAENVLWCTGSNEESQFGISNKNTYKTNVPLMFDEKYKIVDIVSYCHTTIFKTAEEIFMCGNIKSAKYDLVEQRKKSEIINLSKFDFVSALAFEDDFYMLDKEGCLWVSGNNTYGQHGTGNFEPRYRFIKVRNGIKRI